MKGLLIKDLKLLKNQRLFLLLMAVISISLLAEGRNPAFVFTYASAMLSVITISTISYDDADNGMGYLLTLPLSRKDYVREKYALGLLLVIAVFAALSAILLLFAFTGSASDLDKTEFIAMVTGAMISAVAIQSAMIPLQLKFGPEKSRLALLVLMAFAAVAIYGTVQLGKVLDVDIFPFLDRLALAKPWALWGAAAILSLGLMGISYTVSLGIMNRKQF